ncbi:hypothetical protein [Bartonella sp. DGB1]|uniref:F0F1 ATP synthase subunit B family protein n=1 Tax=Bartonella sp. DGB1 TaxID=3239807 RepID=UPI003523F9AA
MLDAEIVKNNQSVKYSQNLSLDNLSIKSDNSIVIAKMNETTEISTLLSYNNSSAKMMNNEVVKTHENRAFPPFDSSYFVSHIFWLIISFGLFYLFISRLLLPRLTSIIANRRKLIEDDLNLAAENKEKVDELIKNYQKSLEEAKIEAREIATDSLLKARLEVQEKRQIIERKVKNTLTEGLNLLDQNKQQALTNVKGMVADISTDIIDKLIGSNKISNEKISSVIEKLKVGEKI